MHMPAASGWFSGLGVTFVAERCVQVERAKRLTVLMAHRKRHTWPL
jgi:hypothetical protein